jgi:hypothetical protein
MATPEVSRQAIRWLQAGAADATKRAFEIDEHGNFVVDTVVIEALAGPA